MEEEEVGNNNKIMLLGHRESLVRDMIKMLPPSEEVSLARGPFAAPNAENNFGSGKDLGPTTYDPTF